MHIHIYSRFLDSAEAGKVEKANKLIYIYTLIYAHTSYRICGHEHVYLFMNVYIHIYLDMYIHIYSRFLDRAEAGEMEKADKRIFIY
jgi:hypothetical protein